MSIFRIVRAEFVKVLKKPMIYIMALVLVAAIFGAHYVYQPNAFNDSTVSYNDTLDITLYYNTFMSDTNESKKQFDAEINKAHTKYSYYVLQNIRKNKLTELYNDIVKDYNTLAKEINSSDSNYMSARRTAFFKLKDSLLTYQSYYTNFDNKFYSFKDYPFIMTLSNSQEYINGKATLDEIISIYFTPINDVTYNNDSAVNVERAFPTSKYLEKLSTINDNAINFITFTLEKYFNRITTAYNNLKLEVNKGSGTYTPSKATEFYKIYVKTVEDYKALFDEMVTNSYYPIILLSDEVYDLAYKVSIIGMFSEINEVNSKINSGKNQQTSYKEMCEYVETSGFQTNLNRFHTEAKQIYITTDTLNKISKGKDYTESNQNALIENINNSVSNKIFSDLEKNVTSYKLLSQTINTYIDNYIVYELATHQEYVNISSFYGSCFDDYNQYKTDETIALNYYYLETNTYSNSYTNNLSLLNSSSNESNMFDFIYFAMEICTIIIIVFSMVLCTSLITQEIETGTIKLLLVRPYKRSTILTAKLLTTLFFSILFIIFSTIISGVAGFVYYGYISNNILVVIDATTVISLSPIVVILLDLLSILIDVIFFILIAIFFSVISKNFASTLCFCASTVILMLVLNLFFGNAFWYSFLPFMNLHLFKYFGNAFILGSESVLNKLLITGIVSSMNLVYSALITLAYSIIFIVISYTIFNKRNF